MGTILTSDFVGSANTDAGVWRTSATSCHSDGTLVVAVKDGSGGSKRNIKVLTSTNNGDTWTQRASITAPVDISQIAIAQATNGMIHVVAKQADNLGFRHCTVTWSTWAVSAWNTTFVTYSSPSSIGEFDVDCSDGGALGLAFQLWGGSSQLYTIVFHRTNGGTWTRVVNETLLAQSGASRRAAGETVSIVALNLNGSNRQWVVAEAVLSSKEDGGISYSGLRVNESTGAAVDLDSTKPGVRSYYFFHGYGLATTTTSGRKRVVQLFRTGTDEFTAMSMWYHTSSNVWYEQSHTVTAPATGTGYGTDRYTTTDSSSATVPSTYTAQILTNFGFTIDANRNKVFRYLITGTSAVAPKIVGDIHAIDGSYDRYYYGMSYFTANSSVLVMSISHGSKRNLGLAKHAFFYQFWIQGPSVAATVSVVEVPPNPGGNSAIVSLSPPPAAEQQLANPALAAVVDTGAQFSQSQYSIEFQFATDSSFTTNLVSYLQGMTKSKKVDGTNTDGVTVTFSDTLPTAYNLSKTVWYYRARLVDVFGNVGVWTASQTLTVGHPPTGQPTSPTGGGFYNWNAGQRTFTWNFYDPSPTDYQTAYRVVVTELDTGATVFDTGKIVSSSKSHNYTFSAGSKDKDLLWAAQLWDSDDTAGPLSAWSAFNLTDPTSATVQSPTSGQTLATGIPTFVFTPTTGGGRTIKEYTVMVTQGPDIIWSRRVPAVIASGTQQSVTMEQGILKNNTNYSMQVLVTDVSGNLGSSPVVPFTVAWVPPASPTGLAVTANKYNIEDEGFVLVSWDDTARDPDFVSWSLYRKADMVDQVGVVVEEGEWEMVFRDYSSGALYAYKDFFAPASHLVTYRVVQSINRLGQDMDSDPSDTGSIVPVSDGYWLIEPTSDNTDADAFKLSIVTGDSFTEEQEESEFTVIGRGRIVNKGQKLGVKGTLDVQLRNTGGTTARQKRLRLLEIQKEVRQLYLRNPFGDIFRVSVSGMSISRIAGVGRDEFCDVSIPYSEVS